MNAKELKTTVAYTQLRKFIEVNVEDPTKRPYALGQLVKRYLARAGDRIAHPDLAVSGSFIWWHTPEGQWWAEVAAGHKVAILNPCPIGGGEVKARVVEQPKKKVGWW